VYAARDERVTVPGTVYVQLAAMLWLTVALTALAYSMRRRAARVESLLEVRRRLVSEVLQADARNSRALSEQLHDGPLQNLIAARFDVHELRTSPSGAAIDRIDAALLEASAALRATVSTLHPQVLEQAGLASALQQLIAGHEQRWDIPIDAEIDDVGRPAGQALLYRAARELLLNATKHSRAERLRVRLGRSGDTVTLIVADDGIGFDPEVLVDRVAQGHIGLASLMAGIEAMGGSVRLETDEGTGTAVTVTLPDVPVRR
jgi:two-component system NarL family sensor kinase